jgi:hypothetical protein
MVYRIGPMHNALHSHGSSLLIKVLKILSCHSSTEIAKATGHFSSPGLNYRRKQRVQGRNCDTTSCLWYEGKAPESITHNHNGII